MSKASKESLLLELSGILIKESIKPFIKRIGEIRELLYELTTDEEELNITNRIKDKIQKEAYIAWVNAGYRGGIYLATGVGKSRIGVKAVMLANKANTGTKPVLVVPTERLRDIGWKEEFEKWQHTEDWVTVEPICYVSMGTISGKKKILLILDEGHNITEANMEFFDVNEVEAIMVLTATPPDPFSEKVRLFSQMGIHEVYSLSLDEAVTLGIAAPYNITIVTMPLDSEKAYIKGGRKPNYFYQTEVAKYNFLTKSTYSSNNPMSRIQRMQFIYKINSKVVAANKLLSLIPEDLKTLVFCANKKQAINVCDKHYFSKPTLSPKDKSNDEKVADYNFITANYHGDEDLLAWIAEDRGGMSCVEALNEGVNLGKTDIAFIVQLNSKRLHFIQRAGRILRYYRGHVGEIIILAVRDTVDYEWAHKAIRGLDTTKIRHITLEDVLSGKQQLLINQKQEENVTANI